MMDYKTFVMNLNSLKAYKEEIARLNSELDRMLSDPYSREAKRLGINDFEFRQIELNYYVTAVEMTEKALERIPEEIRKILEEIYIGHRSFIGLGAEIGYSGHGLWSYLKRETEKYL